METFTGVRCTRFEGNKIIVSVLLDSQFTFLILYGYEFLFLNLFYDYHRATRRVLKAESIHLS